MDSYDVQDVIDAEITLEPMKCRHCGSIGETTFNRSIGDAYCATCGRWQLEEDSRITVKEIETVNS